MSRVTGRRPAGDPGQALSVPRDGGWRAPDGGQDTPAPRRVSGQAGIQGPGREASESRADGQTSTDGQTGGQPRRQELFPGTRDGGRGPGRDGSQGPGPGSPGTHPGTHPGTRPGPRPGTGPPTLLVLVVSPTDTGAQAAHEVGRQLHYCEVAYQHSVEEMLAFVATRPDAVVPLMMVSDEVGSLDVLAGRLQDRPALRTTRLLLLTRRDELTHLGRALDEDWVHEVVSVPWTPGALGHRAGAHVTRWLRETLPDDPRLAHLDADTPPDLPQASLLSKFAGDDDELVAELVAACERVLGPRPRLHLPRGVRVTREGMPVDAVYILEHGTVALTRVTRAGKVTLHHATTGRIIGILSLASQGSAFVTATTTSEVELILLSVEQLDRALRGDPMTGEALAALLIRSLVGRLERSEILQVEKIELHAALDAERSRLEKERARLAEALDALEQARLELLAQERFATLGELAAGVAHELNNPVAALERASAHEGAAVATLLASHPRGDLARAALERARNLPARSTADERALRRRLEKAVRDRETARRLVAAGVEDPGEAARLARSTADLALVEAAAGVGRGERNTVLATARIRSLVAALSAYVRPEGGAQERVDVRESVEDALRLVAHRLDHVEVVRDYSQVPLVPARAGELVQVWTNLISNAADALARGATAAAGSTPVVAGSAPAAAGGTPAAAGGTPAVAGSAPDASLGPPTLTLSVRPQDGGVRVDVVDNGPGIAREHLERIFEPRFTTNHGQVRYGLGLGMGLAKSVVDAHGGTITVVSRPGRTRVSVTLPPQIPGALAAAPANPKEES